MNRFPESSVAPLVSRTTAPALHEWTGNEDDAGHHHAPLSINEVPCYLGLYWRSNRAGRTVHVGTYRLNLRRLATAGFARLEGTRKVRLRFVRESDGVVVIQINNEGPKLPVGDAVFV